MNGKGCACAQAQTVRQTTAAGEHLHVTVVMVHMNLAIHVSADCTWPRTKTQAVRLRKTPAARGEPLHSTVVVVVMHQDHLAHVPVLVHGQTTAFVEHQVVPGGRPPRWFLLSACKASAVPVAAGSARAGRNAGSGVRNAELPERSDVV